ncbi:MFS transporter [Mesobacillus zeae]|uniref:MFS transporter n=1 Tax=Mesobacillus zeae TaxID=1917180 RepID=A0A398BDD2_9BACI|nr:MFS transporter [Mesobacillus zeae]RID85603.1 MFS transporter [Mesobacillus zeae]
MKQQDKRTLYLLQGFYLFAFFGFGSLAPLLSVYLSEVEKLNGYQIGTLLSIGPVITIFFQPLWGMVADLKNAHNRVLTITTALAGIFGLGYLIFGQYYWLLFVAVMTGVFQSAIIPLSDSISLKFSGKARINYGNIRLFGSLGFGLAVFVMGRLSEWNPQAIFYAFFITLILAAIISLRFPRENSSGSTKMLGGMKELLGIKQFVVFMFVTFLVFGPNLANNFYFGLFLEDRGGTYTGIGIAFLIAVLSEIPFMRAAGFLINRIGLLQVAAIGGLVSLLRWSFYFTQPDLSIIYISSVVQGFSLGLFIPAGLQYVKQVTPVAVTATAVTIYSAIGNGLGNWFFTFVGGMIFEVYSIYSIYLFFAVMTSAGVLLTLWLIKKEKEDVKAGKEVLAQHIASK